MHAAQTRAVVKHSSNQWHLCSVHPSPTPTNTPPPAWHGKSLLLPPNSDTGGLVTDSWHEFEWQKLTFLQRRFGEVPTGDRESATTHSKLICQPACFRDAPAWAGGVGCGATTPLLRRRPSRFAHSERFGPSLLATLRPEALVHAVTRVQWLKQR